MIKIPALTEERRKEIVKVASKIAEEAKIGIRNVRGDYKKKIDTAKNEKTISEDEAKMHENSLQKAVDESVKQVESIFADKEKDILKK